MINMLSIIQRGRLIGLALAVIAMPFSITICHAGLWIALLFILLDGYWRQNVVAILTHPVVILYGIFMLLHLSGLIYSEDIDNGWLNVNKKSALLLAPVGLAATSRLQARHRDILFWCFVLSCLACTLVCVIHAWQVCYSGVLSSGKNISSFMNSSYWELSKGRSERWIYFSYEELASGIHIHPTYFSLYLVFCLLLLDRFLVDAFSRLQQAVILIMAAYAGVFIIFLASKITTLALLMLVAAVALRRLSRYALMVRMAALLLTVGFFVLVIRINPVSWYRDYQEIRHHPVAFPPAAQNSMSTSIRTSLWWLGIRSIEDINPVWGAGTGDVSRVMAAAAGKYGVSNILGSNDPHNQFLNTLIGLGFAGLIVLCACFILPAYWAIRSKNTFYLAFLGIFIMVCLTESAFEFQKGIVFFSLFNSLLIFHDTKWSVLPLIPVPHD